jgi:hypothetical protein
MPRPEQSSARSSPAPAPLNKTVLPPDGKLIIVSQWRRQITWGVFILFALCDLSIAIVAFTLGNLNGFALGLACLLFAAFSLLAPMTGLSLERQGIRVRMALWTYHWSWNQVARFELKPRGYIPRLRIHLRDGRVKKVRGGFFTRRPEEEERAQALVNALEERLKAEQGE